MDRSTRVKRGVSDNSECNYSKQEMLRRVHDFYFVTFIHLRDIVYRHTSMTVSRNICRCV
jgi:hypothetical protein